MDVLVVTVVHDPQDTRIRHRQINALRDAGHHVTFAAPFRAYERPEPGDVAAVDLPRARGRDRRAALTAARALLRERGREFDVVLLHDPELVLATVGVDVPGAVWDVHEDTAAAIAMKPWLPRLVKPAAVMLVRGIERLAERRMPLLLAEESYVERFRRAHPVVRNSALVPDESLLHPGPPQNRVVYLGRLTRERGALEMIELARRLTPHITVDLVGPADGGCRAELAAAHDDGLLRWHGFRPNDEARTMLPGALAGLSLLHDQPNYAHSLPTKIIEYMAHGVPVVTTPNPASTALVTGHDCGVVVPFGDVGVAEIAIRKLADAPEEHHRLATAGRAAAVEHYSWQAEAAVFVRTLEDLAADIPR